MNDPKLNPDNARHLQASLRTRTQAEKRLEGAQQEDEIVEASEGLLAAERGYASSVTRCEDQIRRDRERG